MHYAIIVIDSRRFGLKLVTSFIFEADLETRQWCNEVSDTMLAEASELRTNAVVLKAVLAHVQTHSECA